MKIQETYHSVLPGAPEIFEGCSELNRILKLNTGEDEQLWIGASVYASYMSTVPPSSTEEVSRFWVPFGGSFLSDSEGWLSDPLRVYPLGYSGNPEAVSTAQLSERCSVVLLGEPGMGKSVALNSLAAYDRGMNRPRFFAAPMRVPSPVGMAL